MLRLELLPPPRLSRPPPRLREPSLLSDSPELESPLPLLSLLPLLDEDGEEKWSLRFDF